MSRKENGMIPKKKDATKLISDFTPITKISQNSNVDLSSILNNEHDNSNNNDTNEITKTSIIESNTSESSVPSGTTDILNAIGDDWMTFLVENEYNNNHNNYDQGSNKYNNNDEILKALDNSLNKNNIDNTDTLNTIRNDCMTSIENECDNDFSNNSHNNYDQVTSNDDLIKDPDFSLNSDEIAKTRETERDYLNQNSTNNTINNTNDINKTYTIQSHTSKDDLSTEIPSPVLDIRNVHVPCSKDYSSKRTVKKHFCPYCKKLQTKFARHLELKHKREADVQKFIHIKKGTPERAKIIAAIRNHGSLLHNTQQELNSGVFITVRQQQAKYKRTAANDYICWTNCKGFYSKLTIRLHYVKQHIKKMYVKLLLWVND